MGPDCSRGGFEGKSELSGDEWQSGALWLYI